MNLWQRIINRFVVRPGQSRIYISTGQAGVTINEDTALAFSAVSACIRIISETMASLPWHIYRRAPVGREALPTHPAQYLLNVQANPEMSAYIFKRTVIAHLLQYGNGYAEIERGMDGRAVWLWPIPPDRTELQRNNDGELELLVRGEGTDAKRIPIRNVLHFPDSSFDGLQGVSRITLARRAVGTGIAQDVFAARYYANGAHIGGVIENKGKQLSEEAVDALLEDFNNKYQGPDRSHKTVYLDAGMEFKALTIPLTDAQFLETRRFQVEEIARWYGVPMHLLNDLTDANYAVSYEASKNFIEHTIRPIAVMLESQANMRLIADRQQSSIFSKINLNGLLRADPRARAEYYRSMINAGVMSINEIRELEELNSIGSDGDEHYLQVNMAPISSIKKIAEQAIREPKQENVVEEKTDPADVVKSLNLKRK